MFKKKIIVENSYFPLEHSSEEAAGWDIKAAGAYVIAAKSVCLIKTGIKIQLPKGWEVQVRSRSGMALKNQIFVLNSPGTIDSDYTGEVMVIMYNLSDQDYKVNHGDKIAQIVFNKLPKIKIIEGIVNKITKRGVFGFGSTGK